ncbi:MAG: hypothetical protein EAX86_03030 [Candidatus Heimdallarchaeota archaeon]|nr:hypothetical protein [Candidatus Heimdallarchaeota archaeon]
MKFDFKDPLKGLDLKLKICDSHVHIWAVDAYPKLEKWAELFGIKRFLGIAQPEIKKGLEKNGTSANIIFAYYMPVDAWAHYDIPKLLSAVDEAIKFGYPVVKMWFGPRFLDLTKSEKEFSISSPNFDPVFSKIEEQDLIVDIHVADPDYWYQTTYTNVKKYRTKKTALNEFCCVLEKHPSMKAISIHFGSLPEDLNLLSNILEKFPNLSIDTASTKWMIRELGKNLEDSREFILNHSDRILFATDLSVGWGDRTDNYYASRYWSQRIFWETDVKGIELPFDDTDNPNPPTLINGLNLPVPILQNIYWKNALEIFKEL